MTPLMKKKGITFMEILVVLAIAAIAAVLAIPLYQHYINQSRLKAAAENLYHHLDYTRSQAQKLQMTITNVFQTGSSWCFGSTTANTCNCNLDSSCNQGQTGSSNHTGITLNLTNMANTFTFDKDRGVSSDPGTITFSNSVGTISIIVNQMGSVRICSSDVGGYEACS